MVVHIAGQEIEQVALTELQVDGGKPQSCQCLKAGPIKSRLEASSRCWATVFGPVATVGWLRETLAAEGHGDEALLKPGAVVICSTPGGLCALHIYDTYPAQPSLPDDQIDGVADPA